MIRTAFRHNSNMASQNSVLFSPFSKAVVNTMRKLYPESLADKSFDNTGLLLESPLNRDKRLNNSALLTVDLTKAVADEAIKRRDSIIIAYHPIIFRGLKSLNLNNSQQQSLLRLAQEGISVYSPHTAVDAIPGGMADWLCNITVRDILPVYRQPPINPIPLPPPGFEGAGSGRLISFGTPQPLNDLLENISAGAFPGERRRGLTLAIPQTKEASAIKIRTVATCAGSGSSILMKNGMPIADLLVTGELSHHDALAATEAGSVVVSLFHTNSERGYLRSVMARKLEMALGDEWAKVRKEMTDTYKDGDALKKILGNPDIKVDVSDEDRDPYEIKMWGM